MVALLVVLALVAGCATDSGNPDGALEASGVVIDVDASGPATVERFTINTDDGRVLDFHVGTLDISNGGLPAPHLRDHLVSGEPISVTYTIDEEGRNVALRYVDA